MLACDTFPRTRLLNELNEDEWHFWLSLPYLWKGKHDSYWCLPCSPAFRSNLSPQLKTHRRSHWIGVKKYIYEAIWLLRFNLLIKSQQPFNLLISRKYRHFSACIESWIVSHSLHATEMFSPVPTANQGGESPQLLTKHSILVIAKFELYYIYTYICSLFHNCF